MTWLDGIEKIAVPVLTGALGWFSARWTRRSDALQSMQNTIDRISKTNDELYEKINKIQEENVSLRLEVKGLKSENTFLKRRITELSEQVQRFQNH